MAERLTETYRYIGRSSPVPCPSGYEYYILVYARTEGDDSTGKHTVSIKARLACNVDASFYGFTTTASAKADNVTAWAWTKQQIPYDYWGDSASLTENGVTYPRWTELKEGYAVVDAGYGADKEITIDVSWVMNSSSSQGWFPQTGVVAKASIPVILPMLSGESGFGISGNGTTEAGNVYVVCNGSNTLKVTVSGDSPSFTHRLAFRMGDQLINEADGVKTEYSYKPEPAVWLPRITDSKNTAALADGAAPSVTVTTFDGSGRQIGGAAVKRFDIYVPEEYAPVVTFGNAEPVSELAEPFRSLFIQGKSRAKVRFDASAQYSAEIKVCTVTVEGKSYTEDDNYTTGYLSGYGKKTVKVTAEDSRGHIGTGEGFFTVLAYSSPKIEVKECGRCDLDGNADDSGGYLKITATRRYSTVPDVEGNNLNGCSIRFRCKSDGTEYGEWITILPGTDTASDTVETAPLLEGALDPKSAYAVQIGVIDDVGSAVETVFGLGGEEVYMHRTRNAMGLGKYVQGQRLFDCGWDAWFRGAVLIGESGQTLEEYIRSIIAGGDSNGNV